MPQPGDPYADAFGSEVGQCWRMIHDRQGQATHCAHFGLDDFYVLMGNLSVKHLEPPSTEDLKIAPDLALKLITALT
jgi:hypothetical protein